MSAKNLRAAVIGCGRIGSTFADDANRDKIGVYSHAEAYVICEGVELMAVCDADAGLARACGERWRVENVYTDAVEMFAQEPIDLVSICTPDETHYAVALAALEAEGPRGILMEKPLSTNLESGEDLIQRCRERDVTLAINYSRRYSPVFQELKEAVVGGVIGKIQAVHGYYTKGIIHNGTHWIDLLRFLVGDVTRAEVVGGVPEKSGDPDVDARLRLKCGASAVLQVVDASAYTVFEMDLLGERGRIRIRDSGHTIEQFEVGPSPFYEGYEGLLDAERVFRNPMNDLTLRAVEDLRNAVINGQVPRCTGRDAVTALKLALEICGR